MTCPPTEPPAALEYVWYVAYGSNMHADRLTYYLTGGQPAGAARTYPGCRDTSLPRATVPVLLPGGIYFAMESLTWGGGMAFYDPDLPGRAAARAYLIGAAQFADIAAQEMHRPPPGVDAAQLVRATREGRLTLGPGRYETLVCAGVRDGHPMLTFTAPWRAADVPATRPAATYLARLASGLREAHGWGAARITAYLAGCPGVRDGWDPGDLAAVIGATVGT